MKVKKSLAVEMASAARNDLQALKPYLILGGLNKQFDFCPPSPQAEQIFLFKRWRKEKDLLKLFRD